MTLSKTDFLIDSKSHIREKNGKLIRSKLKNVFSLRHLVKKTTEREKMKLYQQSADIRKVIKDFIQNT